MHKEMEDPGKYFSSHSVWPHEPGKSFIPIQKKQQTSMMPLTQFVIPWNAVISYYLILVTLLPLVSAPVQFCSPSTTATTFAVFYFKNSQSRGFNLVGRSLSKRSHTTESPQAMLSNNWGKSLSGKTETKQKKANWGSCAGGRKPQKCINIFTEI